MMVCNAVASTNNFTNPLSSSSSSRKTSAVISCHLSFPHRILIPILSTSLSFSLLFSSPAPTFASTIVTNDTTTTATTSDSTCLEEAQLEEEEEESTRNYGPKINEAIVEETWEIVNDGFLDSGRRKWSPEAWMQKKEDIIGTSIQTRTKAHDVIKKMLASLGDPYTRFLSPEEFSKMSRYDITGVGINLREIPDDNGNVKLKVLGLILDGPAHAAGVRQGDEILSVNGMNVKGKSAFEVSSLLQGPSETFVTIEVKHGSCGPIQSFNIQRQIVARSPVFYRLEQVDDGKTYVGYIRLKEFNGLARKDLVIAMKRLQDMGASYFILDLRDNLGGLVQAGIEVAKLFLNKGDTVIYTVGRDPRYESTISAETAPLVSDPLIVLVNNRTASASEIVASALHDNCRAVLVGEKTFGKGLIQSVFELRDGSGVVVTIGKYVTRNHMDINGNGIEPDFRKLPAWSDVAKRLSQCSRPSEG